MRQSGTLHRRTHAPDKRREKLALDLVNSHNCRGPSVALDDHDVAAAPPQAFRRPRGPSFNRHTERKGRIGSLCKSGTFLHHMLLAIFRIFHHHHLRKSTSHKHRYSNDHRIDDEPTRVSALCCINDTAGGQLPWPLTLRTATSFLTNAATAAAGYDTNRPLTDKDR